MQIGEVAHRTGLSLRTIRHYEEVGLLPAAERSAGGFRLYDEDAVAHLLLIKQMKPLGFTLEQMRDLIDVREQLDQPDLPSSTRPELLTRLGEFRGLVVDELARLRARVDDARAFADQLDAELTQHLRQ